MVDVLAALRKWDAARLVYHMAEAEGADNTAQLQHEARQAHDEYVAAARCKEDTPK
jgi:hypothetical protein